MEEYEKFRTVIYNKNFNKVFSFISNMENLSNINKAIRLTLKNFSIDDIKKNKNTISETSKNTRLFSCIETICSSENYENLINNKEFGNALEEIKIKEKCLLFQVHQTFIFNNFVSSIRYMVFNANYKEFIFQLLSNSNARDSSGVENFVSLVNLTYLHFDRSWVRDKHIEILKEMSETTPFLENNNYNEIKLNINKIKDLRIRQCFLAILVQENVGKNNFDKAFELAKAINDGVYSEGPYSDNAWVVILKNLIKEGKLSKAKEYFSNAWEKKTILKRLSDTKGKDYTGYSYDKLLNILGNRVF